MPKGGPGGVMGGMQLWANLPASQKMMDPRYRDVQSRQIPEVAAAGGARIKVICGDVQGVKGPVGDIVIDPEYLDVSLAAGATFTHPVKAGHTVFAYVFEGEALFGGPKPDAGAGTGPGHVVLFDDGDQIVAAAGGQPARFILVAGKPLHEPVAWAGPIVMNTQDELRTAFDEYNKGTFIKHGPAR
jgi:redox-sensitive bicupin YhaK (pirin superfamily)